MQAGGQRVRRRRRKVINWAGDRMCGSVRLARISVLTSLCYLTPLYLILTRRRLCLISYLYHILAEFLHVYPSSKHGWLVWPGCYLNSWKLHLDKYCSGTQVHLQDSAHLLSSVWCCQCIACIELLSNTELAILVKQYNWKMPSAHPTHPVSLLS